MLYNSYAVTSYTYEDYKKTSFARTESSYSSSKNCNAGSLILKILAVVAVVIVAVTAGLKLAPSAEKISATDSYGCVETGNAEAEDNTIYF